MKRVIGIDIGTTSLSACVLDGETGDILNVISENHHAAVADSPPWQNLQDARLILRKGTALLEQMVSAYGPISGIGLTGQMHGIVYLDKMGRPASSLITWQDSRGELLFPGASGETYTQHISHLSGYKLATGYGTVTHYYNVLNGLVPENAVSFCPIYDALGLAITGRTDPLIHVSSAASMGIFNLEKGEFDQTAIKATGINSVLFPSVTDGKDPIGRTSKGIPVMPGLGDNQASFIGSVRDIGKSLLVNMGTGSQVSCRTKKSISTPVTESRPLTDNDFICAGFSLCGGRSYALLEQFFREIALGGGASVSSMYAYMDALSERAFDLEEPLTINTQFSGTRQDPGFRASIKGLSATNFTPAHFVVGVLQGTIQELFDVYCEMESKLDYRPTVMIGSGNGIRKSKIWRAMFEKTFGIPMYVPVHKEEAAYGAALFALVGSGAYDSLADARRLIQYHQEPVGLW